jgi:serine protease Do
MRSRALTLAAASVVLVGCRGSGGKVARSEGAPKSATCAALTGHLVTFGEALEAASADAKTRGATYPGRLELLMTFEDAVVALDGELGALASKADLGSRVERAHAALERAAEFARAERDAIEKHAKELTPLAKETQQAWATLRNTCEGKRGPPDCAGVRDAVAKFDSAETPAAHERAVAELVALRLPSPGLARARDRAVAASKAVQAAIKLRTETATPIPKQWASIQKGIEGVMDSLGQACRGQAPMRASVVAAERPDPRKLTVLVHVKPPAEVERALLSLAAKATDQDEKAFYTARAEGAFGSGFVLVKNTEQGGTETLVITNRHVIDLGDRAALASADGTSLGAAEIVYSNPTYDLAVLRPSPKLAVKEGFAFAGSPPKDQQTVIATGFPGLAGRPSYQTTRGYVSNESFTIDDGSRPLTYLQHTAPIDPGSSGGPLTDESGRIVGVNTLKVMGRDSVGLAVPSRFVLDTLRTAGTIEARHAAAPNRHKTARLACLAFLGELGAAEPRVLLLEQMIANTLVGTAGLDAAAALGGDEDFEHLWNADSVRAMRIATLVKVRSAFMVGGGPSVLETCDHVDGASVRADHVKFHVRLGNFETRDIALRWEHGRWKFDGVEATRGAKVRPGAAKKLPPPGPPAGAPPSKKVTPPRAR